MSKPDIFNRTAIVAIALLVLLTPVAILLVTLGFLVLAEDLALGRITLLEFIELYLIELALFAVSAYGLYRLTLTLVERQLPDSLDALESRNTGEKVQDASEDRE